MSSYMFTVYLGKLLNIGIYRKGYYLVSLRGYRKDRNELRTICSPVDLDRDCLKKESYQCSSGHYVCNWKCYLPQPQESRFVSDAFLIEYQEEVIDIDKAQMFQVELESMDDYIWLEFELFFSEHQSSVAAILKNASSQRVYIGISPKPSFQAKVYQSVIFKDTYYSTLDVMVSGIGYYDTIPKSITLEHHQQQVDDIVNLIQELSSIDLNQEAKSQVMMMIFQLQKIVRLPMPNSVNDLMNLNEISAMLSSKGFVFIELDPVKFNDECIEISSNLYRLFSNLADFKGELNDKRFDYQKNLLIQDLGITVDAETLSNTLGQFFTILKDVEEDVNIEILESSCHREAVPADQRVLKITTYSTDGIHLLIFVHGFNGGRNDLKLYNNLVTQLSFAMNLETQFLYLHCTSIENNSNKSIVAQGKLLADEIKDCINKSQSPITEISFVCHSMGGLVARCALKELDRYKSLFSSFTTFGTPHLSSFYLQNAVASPLMDAYKLATDSKSLAQIKLQDHVDKRQSLIYHLSEDWRLKCFKVVNLYASKQDRYVQFESALCLPLRAPADASPLPSEDRAIYTEMRRNFTSNCSILNRYHIIFKPDPHESVLNVDLLGRQAHLNMLRNTKIARLSVTLNNIHTIP